MKQYKALFFDFDDTLFDFGKSESIALSETFRQYGIEDIPTMYTLFRRINQAFWRAFENGIYKNESDSAVRFRDFAHALGRADINWREMCEFYLKRLSSTAFPIENSVKLLEELSNHYAIYIITNSLKYVNDRRSKIGGILPFVQDRFISEEIGYSKPNKEYFDYCFAHIPYAKEEVLLIGDGLLSDMKGGINYGIDTCWFNRKGAEKPLHFPITYEITSLWTLKEILK